MMYMRPRSVFQPGMPEAKCSLAAVMLFLKIVLRQIRIAAAPQPELLDELLALFVGIELKKGVALFGRDDVGDVLRQPLPVGAVQFFQRSLHLSLCFSIRLLLCRRGALVPRLLAEDRQDGNCERKHGGD